MNKTRNSWVTDAVSPGGIIGLKIEKHRQEDDPSWLAIQLAEQLHGASLAEGDAQSFGTSALSERQKALQLQHIIFQLEEREKHGTPAAVSRMDPLNTYDLEMCKTELSDIKARAIEFDQKANELSAQAKKYRIAADKYQRLIRQAHAKKRQQS